MDGEEVPRGGTGGGRGYYGQGGDTQRETSNHLVKFLGVTYKISFLCLGTIKSWSKRRYEYLTKPMVSLQGFKTFV